MGFLGGFLALFSMSFGLFKKKVFLLGFFGRIFLGWFFLVIPAGFSRVRSKSENLQKSLLYRLEMGFASSQSDMVKLNFLLSLIIHIWKTWIFLKSSFPSSKKKRTPGPALEECDELVPGQFHHGSVDTAQQLTTELVGLVDGERGPGSTIVEVGVESGHLLRIALPRGKINL